jgi:uncharacterized membrane protein
MELWLVCALLTVVCYGVGEGLAKEPTMRLGSARMLVLYAVGNAPIYAGWFLLGAGWNGFTVPGVGLAVASALCGCLGTVFWFRAIESGTASVVSGFTAAYPVITVAAAVVILGVALVPLHLAAVSLLVAGAVLLAVHEHPDHAGIGRAWVAPMLFAILLWGAWGILERMSIDAVGFAGNAGIYAFVATPLSLVLARRGLRTGGSWDRTGVREALPSLILFGVAGITIFLAVGLGPIAVVECRVQDSRGATLAIGKLKLYGEEADPAPSSDA